MDIMDIMDIINNIYRVGEFPNIDFGEQGKQTLWGKDNRL